MVADGRSRPVRRLAAWSVVPVLIAVGGVVTAVGAAADPPAPMTFTFIGGEQTYTVPQGVTAVTITAVGAPGGTAGRDFSDPEAGSAGGDGATVTATVPVPPGVSTLYVEVGGAGQDFDFGGFGGFNGGGDGGDGADAPGGGGGGGASDVRTTSIADVSNSAMTNATDTRLVVAGGGGGSGSTCAGNGGSGGGVGGTGGDNSQAGPGAGGAGADGNICGLAPGNGGDAGLGGRSGGQGGALGDGGLDVCPGADGALADGGSGGCADGGGGGGGYSGGGGGGDSSSGGGGGGAGSSFWVADASDASMSEDTTGTPSVTITPSTDNPAPVPTPTVTETDVTTAPGPTVTATETTTATETATATATVPGPTHTVTTTAPGPTTTATVTVRPTPQRVPEKLTVTRHSGAVYVNRLYLHATTDPALNGGQISYVLVQPNGHLRSLGSSRTGPRGTSNIRLDIPGKATTVTIRAHLAASKTSKAATVTKKFTVKR